MPITKKRKLEIRNANVNDVDDILLLTLKVYHNMAPYPREAILAQISHYEAGTFVAILDGQLVGYCAAILIQEKLALGNHTWKSITGGGFGATHDPNGDYLYGYEICVDSRVRGLRIGQRFYTARRNLCRNLKLKGIVFAGRIPGFKQRFKKYKTAEAYVEAVKNKEIRDQVLSFQLRNNFEVIGILNNYLPADSDSKGYATHLLWKNHEISDGNGGVNKSSNRENTVRVGAVQYMQRKIDSFEEFERLQRRSLWLNKIPCMPEKSLEVLGRDLVDPLPQRIEVIRDRSSL